MCGRPTTGSVSNVVIEKQAVLLYKRTLSPILNALYVDFVVFFTAHVILLSVGMHSWDIGFVVKPVWPPKSLRSLKVAPGLKRLCTTGLDSGL